ncbi:MAG TPA: hypothetical protein VIV57_03215, partial [Anaeromyxobacter sp.]
MVALAIRVQTRRHGKPKEETLLAMEALGSLAATVDAQHALEEGQSKTAVDKKPLPGAFRPSRVLVEYSRDEG